MTETPSVPAAPRSYRPGGWFGILGSRASVLLPPSEKARVAALWALVDEGAGFDETLDALLAGGLRDLSGFVLVATTDDTTQIVLRGTATARLVTGEEVVELAGDPSATWVERSLTGVTSLSLVLEEGADPMAAGGYAVDSGLVRLARLDFPPPAAEPVPPSDAVVFAQPPAGPLDDPAGTDVAAPAVDDEPVVLDPLDSTPADDAPAPAADLAPPIGEDPLTPPASVADDAAPFADEAPAVDEALETPAAEDPLAASVSAGEPDDAAPPADEAPVIDEALETPAAEDPLAPPVSVGEPDDAAPASDETPAAPDPLAGPPAEEAPAPSEGGADGPAVAGEDHADPFAGPVVDGAADPLGGGVEDAAVPEMPPPDSPPAAFPPPVLPPPPTYPPSLPGPPPGMPPGPPPSWTPGAPPPPPPATAPWPPEASPLSEDERPTNSTEADDAPTRGEDGSGEEFARSPVGIAGQPQAPAVTSRPVARLNISSSGETIDVDRVVVIGRAPEARRFGSTDQPMLVTVDSPHQEISSTHLEIRPGSGADHGSAVATDLGSTNGTVLVQPGLGPEELPPGVAVQLVAGAVLDLGDGVTIRVTNP